ncbi:MAG TPA: hypothetical protein VFN49_02070 [Candidatus Aquilonibacter sp.]|nr:hypothetical protein [Candidatus Aquilonibacter sp.]
MTTRIAQARYGREGGGTVTLVVERYENEPDFQSYALTRFVDPHDPSFASFAGFDVRAELIDLLDGQFEDGSAAFAGAKAELLAAFDVGEAV